MPITKRQTSMGLYGVFIALVGTLDKDTEWIHVSDTLQGTASMSQDDPELTEIYVEESDLPIESNEKAGVRKFTGSIPDMSRGVLETFFKATASSAVMDGETVTRMAMPDSAESIYLMWKFVPKSGAKQLIFTKGKLSAKVNGNMSATETLNVDIVVTSLKSDIVGQKGFYIDLPAGENAGYYIGETLAYVSDSDNALVTVLAYTDASLSMDIDSTTVAKTGLTFAGKTDWDGVIDVLNIAFPTATWSREEEENRMRCTSKMTGIASNVTLNTYVGTGDDLSADAALNLTGGEAVTGS